jgi:hypothetical protein
MQGGRSAPLASGIMTAPELLVTVWFTMIVTRLLAAAVDSSMLVCHPNDEQELPLSWQDECAASCAFQWCPCVHQHVSCPDTLVHTHS